MEEKRGKVQVPTSAIRLHVYYSGTVQGVGFRYTARNLARRYRITGFVKNLPDGRVELVTEGERQEVLGFADDIEQEMRGYIEESQKTLDLAKNEFSSFAIHF